MNDDIQQPAPMNINQQSDLEPQTPPPQPGQQFKPETPPNKPKKSKKKILLIILLLSVLTGAAVAAYFFFFKKDAAAPGPQPQSQQTQESPETTGPTALIYAQSKDTSPEDPEPFELKSLSLNDQKTSTGYDLSKYTLSVVKSATWNEKVALAVEGSADKPASATILYSEDNGKSYKPIWVSKTSTTASELGGQITSITFSTDGSSIIFGHLPKAGDKNQITELALQKENTTTILTTIDEAAAYIHGYDKKSGQVIYTSGCYNCGGSGPQKILLYNTLTKAASTLVESQQNIWNIHPDKTFKKVLYTESTIEVGTITTDTIIKEVTITDKKIKSILTKPKDDPQILETGYLNDSDTAYYSTEKSVTSIKDGKTTELFTTNGRIIDTFYVSNTDVIVQTGEPEGNFSISRFTIKDKKTQEILKGTAPTHRIISVTYKD